MRSSKKQVRHAKNRKDDFYIRDTILPEFLTIVAAVEVGAAIFLTWRPW